MPGLNFGQGLSPEEDQRKFLGEDQETKTLRVKGTFRDHPFPLLLLP